jgi:hypothetical protein
LVEAFFMRGSTPSKAFAVALLAATVLALGACSTSGSSTSTGSNQVSQSSRYQYSGEVYLLRGLANVFSTGLDDMNAKFLRRGINSRVDNHSMWQAYADDIVKRAAAGQVSYPIIIMGHSLGGNASVQMARYLGDKGIKVSYVASFDPTITTYPGPNVLEVDNFYLPNKPDGQATNIVVEGPGFSGQVVNVDARPMAGVDHFNIEKQPQLQDRVMTKAIRYMTPLAVAAEREGGN